MMAAGCRDNTLYFFTLSFQRKRFKRIPERDIHVFLFILVAHICINYIPINDTLFGLSLFRPSDT